MINEIVVVGGGTAGWITALLTQSYYPNKKITLIESETYGILGAGEGTFVHFLYILQRMNIKITDLVKHCDATLKNGMRFTNWNSTSEDDWYYHPFGASSPNLGAYCINNMYHWKIPLAFCNSIYKDEHVSNVDLSSLLSEENKVPYIFKQKDINTDAINHFERLGTYALHFDAVKLASYLKEVAISRGICRVEGIVDKINTDHNDVITSLSIGDVSINCDFVFDCSGFKRLIIGNHYKTKWIEHKDKLLMNNAMPFFVENNTNVIPSYTEATAMKYGWIWKIPVQGRFGCGYVFNDEFTTLEDIKKEIHDKYGEVRYGKHFKFSAGAYEKVWVKNCIAIGLSCSFMEPLEATSIFSSCKILENALMNIEDLSLMNETTMEEFNNSYTKIISTIVDVVSLHYITNRNDTEFWKKCKTIQPTEFNRSLLEKCKRRVLGNVDLERDDIFGTISFLSILEGNKLLPSNHIKNYIDELGGINPQHDDFKNKLKSAVNQSADHYEFLQYLKAN